MRLAVNIDHIATIREARKAREPEPVAAAALAEMAGAQGITVHLRSDRRHINERDVELLRQTVQTKLNVEMAATAEMVAIASRVRPDQVTLVPERPNELTTEGGLDVVLHQSALKATVQQFHDAKIRVSVFIDPAHAQVKAARAIGADAVEFNTGPFATARASEQTQQVSLLADVASIAARHDFEVLAGHGLTYFNVQAIVGIREIEELNIGHSIVARSSLVGMERAVRDMVALLSR